MIENVHRRIISVLISCSNFQIEKKLLRFVSAPFSRPGLKLHFNVVFFARRYMKLSRKATTSRPVNFAIKETDTKNEKDV